MQITHFGHACVLVETGSARLLIDPGSFSAGFENARELDAILITHQHPDHLDFSRVPALLDANPDAQLVTDPGSAEMIRERDLPVTEVRPGNAMDINDTIVNVVGGEHAVIHPDIPIVPNTGFVIDHGAFYHPGDSFHLPAESIDVLALPTGAPWLKLSEAVDFLRAVAPRSAVPIHEAVLAMPELHYRMFDTLKPEGTKVDVLTRSEPTAV